MKLAFDTGGTFTDFALLDDHGELHVHKVLSTPSDPARAVLQGIDELLARLGRAHTGEALPVFGATTAVTNAVLERKGARVAFLTTKGFHDLLTIRTEGRYDMYDFDSRYPDPLAPRELSFGLEGRVTVEGLEVSPLSEADVRQVITRLRDAGVESVAVCLLHSYKYPEHERRIGALLEQGLPGVPVSLSSAVCPVVREFDRASTTVINAYTQPIMTRHVSHLSQELGARGLGDQLFFMTSSGGMLPGPSAAEVPARLIESGPAAGALAAAEYGRFAGEKNVLSFDMGGTTAKLCLVRDGAPSMDQNMEVARVERFKQGSGYPLRIQSIHLIEIGAGGGSIASADQLGLLRVGPRSAGAAPGPACYGKGGTEATVTDADLLLGYLDASSFLGGGMKLDARAAAGAAERLAAKLGVTLERCAWGIHDLVNESMAKAAAVHAVECGADPRAFTLVAFGGAGPVHAYGVARKLGIRQVVCPLGAGIASAIGLLAAPVAVDLAASLPMRLHRWDGAAMHGLLASLVNEGREVVRSAGVADELIEIRYTVDMRHVGQGHEITVPVPDVHLPEEALREQLLQAFSSAYESLYGRRVAGAEVEAITWRVRVSGPESRYRNTSFSADKASKQNAWVGSRPVYFSEAGGYVETAVYNHYALTPGVVLSGPAIIEQRESTAVMGPGATATIDPSGNLVMKLG